MNTKIYINTWQNVTHRHPRNVCVTTEANAVAIGVNVYGHKATAHAVNPRHL